MRFVTGLIFGASLTLLAATAYTGHLPFDVKALTGAFATKAPLQLPVTSESPPAAAVGTSVEPIAEADASLPQVPEPTPQPAPLAATTPTPPPAEPIVADAGGRQAVWTPFHSEASARGFAGRLTSQLDHPFQVERLAPQTYVVTFNYRSEPERRDIETRLHALTGTGAS